ncbi:uncharacterized protein B0I36DRAFT_350657 [Microdochium trichocladiopsis]|uniref:Uncharacterized protein n=1 Tax=Microdochium trichocladiopsis TaxID=1682393 RepID=A0A9P8Y5T6_9PEZI|nr:uncharacterized protein B0I36DRAFT_350657 [Microdochium trichocladiopsis]KAH7029855.1 hypothetical protein B0I36DRAFT_350657 [Microdochium trichocladiopsis]
MSLYLSGVHSLITCLSFPFSGVEDIERSLVIGSERGEEPLNGAQFEVRVVDWLGASIPIVKPLCLQCQVVLLLKEVAFWSKCLVKFLASAPSSAHQEVVRDINRGAIHGNPSARLIVDLDQRAFQRIREGCETHRAEQHISRKEDVAAVVSHFCTVVGLRIVKAIR